MKVVIVESPAKAKTINKYLGKGYDVVASFGHIRDLPPKDGSVDPDQDFIMTWAIDGKASKRVSEIASAVKNSDGLILATDPDREGEAISWHIVETLNARKALKGIPVERVTFNAITKDAVKDAMAHPRDVDQAGRPRQPHRHHRNEGLAAGDEARFRIGGEEGARFIERGGPRVFEGGRFHGAAL